MSMYDTGSPFSIPSLSGSASAESVLDQLAEAAATEGARGPRVMQMRASAKGMTLVPNAQLEALLRKAQGADAMQVQANANASNWRALGSKAELGGLQTGLAGNAAGNNTITITGAAGAYSTYLRIAMGGTAPGCALSAINLNNNRLCDAVIITPTQRSLIIPFPAPVQLEQSSTLGYTYAGLGAGGDSIGLSFGLGFTDPRMAS